MASFSYTTTTNNNNNKRRKVLINLNNNEENVVEKEHTKTKEEIIFDELHDGIKLLCNNNNRCSNRDLQEKYYLLERLAAVIKCNVNNMNIVKDI